MSKSWYSSTTFRASPMHTGFSARIHSSTRFFSSPRLGGLLDSLHSAHWLLH